MGYGRNRTWQGPQWEPLGDYEVNEHLPELIRSGLGLAEYARQKGIHRRALAEGIRRADPQRYEQLVADGVIGKQGDKARTGTKLEVSAKGMLERKKGGEWLVFNAHGSHGIADLIALRAGFPPLLIQAKKDGKLGPDEWNELVAAAEKAGAWPVLVRRPDGETKGALWYRLTSQRPKGSRLADYLEEFDPREPAQASLLALA